ncbi:MAG: type II toxin-antitoxin system RelE/ParE family toxin [Gemmatimonadales bacterium]|nr:type II toxin-antitoxin system RelE/ParE family toxin [Gemmatimonadales bacterium]
MRVSFRPEAAADIADARLWYEDRRPGLGAAFEEAVAAAITFVRDTPQAFPVVHRDVRRVLLHRFPYALYYRIEDNKIRVIACLHMRRHPGTWKGRG